MSTLSTGSEKATANVTLVAAVGLVAPSAIDSTMGTMPSTTMSLLVPRNPASPMAGKLRFAFETTTLLIAPPFNTSALVKE